MQRQQAIMQQRAMQAQIQAQGGMSGMQPGMQGMNPQQIQQMQQNNPGMGHPGQVQLPAHLMQQQQQLLLRQQAAAQHNQQMQQQQQQQQLAMQQQASQHGNQGGQPGPPNQQGTPGPQPGQMRPQSRMANPNEQNQPAQQNAQQGQQGQPQGQQNQQGGQPQNPQQQGQQQPMNPQQMQMMQQRARMMQMQQQQQNAAMRAQSMAQAQQLTGQAILSFLNMCDSLGSFGPQNGNDIDHWRGFVDKHFAPEAELCHGFQYNENTSKEFRVLRPSIARYFSQYFASGAQAIRITTEKIQEERIQPNNRLRVSSAVATLCVTYQNGARLEMKGNLTADFGPSMLPELIEQLQFYTENSEEVIARTQIDQLLKNFSPTMSNKASPKLPKKNPPKQQKMQGSQYDGLTIDHFPKARIGSWGGPTEVQTFLEVSSITYQTVLSYMITDTFLPARRNLQRNGGPNGLRARKETPPRCRPRTNQPLLPKRRPTRLRRPEPATTTREPTTEPPTQRRPHGQPHTQHAIHEHAPKPIRLPLHLEHEPANAKRHPHERQPAHLARARLATRWRRYAGRSYAVAGSSEHGRAAYDAAAFGTGDEFVCGEREY